MKHFLTAILISASSIAFGGAGGTMPVYPLQPSNLPLPNKSSMLLGSVEYSDAIIEARKFLSDRQIMLVTSVSETALSPYSFEVTVSLKKICIDKWPAPSDCGGSAGNVTAIFDVNIDGPPSMHDVKFVPMLK